MKARFNPSLAAPGQIKGQSPLLSAQEHILHHTELLHDGIATLHLTHSKEHLALAHKIFIKDYNIVRMEKDDESWLGSISASKAIQAANKSHEYKALKKKKLLLSIASRSSSKPPSSNALSLNEVYCRKTSITTTAKIFIQSPASFVLFKEMSINLLVTPSPTCLPTMRMLS